MCVLAYESPWDLVVCVLKVDDWDPVLQYGFSYKSRLAATNNSLKLHTSMDSIHGRITLPFAILRTVRSSTVHSLQHSHYLLQYCMGSIGDWIAVTSTGQLLATPLFSVRRRYLRWTPFPGCKSSSLSLFLRWASRLPTPRLWPFGQPNEKW